MQQPWQDPLLVRTAQHLEALPFEITGQILEDLQLVQILDLFSCGGQRLREAIQYLSHWQHLLRDETEEVEYLWRSLNQLAWTQYRSSWARVNGHEFETWLSEAGLRYRATTNVASTKSYIISALHRHLQNSFFTLIGLEHYRGRWVSTPELKAAIHYVPDKSKLAKWAGKGITTGHDVLSSLIAISLTSKFNWYQALEDLFATNIARGFQNDKHSLDMSEILSDLKGAYLELFRRQSDELETLADLYERFPRFLKVANAPEKPTSEAHVLTRLRLDARRNQRIPRWHFKKEHAHADQNLTLQHTPCRFRYPYTTLVPFDWCLRLLKVVVSKSKLLDVEQKLPSHLEPHYKRAIDGIDYIYCPTPRRFLKRTCDSPPESATFVQYPFSNGVLPKPNAELDWLESFVTIIEWMTKEFPDITNSVASTQLSILRRRCLVDPSDYRLFIEHESPRIISRQLHADLKVCRVQQLSKLPSLLALYMPPWPTPKAVEVAQHLMPYRGCDQDLLQLLYESKISEIRQFLKGAPQRKTPEDGGFLVSDEIDWSETDKDIRKPQGVSKAERQDQTSQSRPQVSERDLVTTANTLRQLFSEKSISSNETGAVVLAHILAQIEDSMSGENGQDVISWGKSVQTYVASHGKPKTQPHCYICGQQLLKPHRTISSMCGPCGDFNLAGSQLSLPPRLSLAGKIAAVTGARVNLGYHTALRLLRCGAKVIASTRYPHDALQRYQAEKDSEGWMDRLLIVGADFRSAKDAFELAREIRQIVQRWGGTLHILINNAAQTLTDSVEKEDSSVRNEERLKSTTARSLLLPQTSYVPKIRAGINARIEGSSSPQQLEINEEARTLGSSWVQSLPQIPYEDVISAHSVNAFVPLILTRELLPIMSDPDGEARGYVVNVSSREGVFERSARAAKRGRHVHTNMSKAALNMIAETEAVEAWRTARVAMNTVDPGYMSASPEFDAVFAGVMPIGWEDGAGRVLWPIAVGELEKAGEEGCRAVWGRFLKHYGASRVNLQQGML
ncbi:hypothetical protein F5B22DRAFT_646492 [Xylaria bambusicola]|uniref:uncharacterized protein n=1 Tax=Xylaria bambusicola TaxID=326684 RepID=UPI002008C349|nr:uncharacterized protein F5B22DRAFT_646492 [Xylaria bambusicola]KAI0516754.1 hypothetical protein F5B22DRAFT_646492 [Xylaria bambusicola]